MRVRHQCRTRRKLVAGLSRLKPRAVPRIRVLVVVLATIVPLVFAAAIPAAASREARSRVVVTLAGGEGRAGAPAAVRALIGSNSRALGQGLVATTANAGEISALRRLDDVVAVEPDATFRSFAIPNDPCYVTPSGCAGQQAWHVDAMHLPGAWDLGKGAGATIAVIDGGIDEGYADLAGKLAVPEIDEIGAGAPGDPSDHGTSVASLAAAQTNNGVGLPGAGWNATLISYRVLTGTSPGGPYAGSLSAVVAAIMNATDRGADVINLSLGGPDSTALRTAIDYALTRGVIVVAAAGNDGASTRVYPAAYDNVIAVGSIGPTGARSSFSNFGPWVDVYAPGEGIIAPGVRNAGGTERILSLDGTSFSSALVSGVAALLDARTPSLDSAAVSKIFVNSGSGIPGVAAPAVDAEQALRFRVPFGSIDAYQQVPSGALVAGWALDPDTTAPIAVDIYIDGTRIRAGANVDRVDLAGFGMGTGHGFSVVVPTTRGGHTACVWMVNDGRGAVNISLGCRTISVPSADVPFGAFDVLRRAPGGVHVAGWAIDPTTPVPVAIDVRVNGSGLTQTSASDPRPDVGSAYPGFGPTRGFGAGLTVPAAAGLDTVCAWAWDVPIPGTNIQLGCKVLAVSNDPFGSVDLVTRVAGNLRVAGWALDPDVAASTDVHVYIDGVPTVVPANVTRTDIAAAYPDYGGVHGFDRTITVGDGAHQLCIAAANQGAGTSQWLGCRQV
jgi:subtilisin family serine protease